MYTCVVLSIIGFKCLVLYWLYTVTKTLYMNLKCLFFIRINLWHFLFRIKNRRCRVSFQLWFDHTNTWFRSRKFSLLIRVTIFLNINKSNQSESLKHFNFSSLPFIYIILNAHFLFFIFMLSSFIQPSSSLHYHHLHQTFINLHQSKIENSKKSSEKQQGKCPISFSLPPKIPTKNRTKIQANKYNENDSSREKLR